jgi:LAO/AO transport system kinase
MLEPDNPGNKPEESEERALPSNLNPRWSIHPRRNMSAGEYVAGILGGDRVALSRAITLVESALGEHRRQALDIIEECLPHSGRSIRIGVTGAPGVGKSTFIDAFGMHLIEQGKKLAVLAVDPTSQVSKGSILGDKTRMPRLAADERVFIRPSPAGESLGGVARKTREAILLCEAAGYDTIIVETVGVGQSETAVHSMVDFFLLLLLPGAGDELQGIKRGIVEMADLIAVNKADGDRIQMAKQARREYLNALHLFPPKENGWTPTAITCSATNGDGIDDVWQTILRFAGQTGANGFFAEHRKRQARYWLLERIDEALRERFYDNPQVKAHLPAIERAVTEGRLSSSKGAEMLLGLFLAR